MRPLRIDFSRPPGQPRRGWLLLALGVVTAGMALTHFTETTRQLEERLRAQRLQQQMLEENSRKASAARMPALPSFVQDPRWHHAARELALPWMDTLRVIEQATKPPVFLLAFKSDPATRRLQLDAEAPNFDSALNYLAALQKAPQLVQTQLLKHDEATSAQGGTLVRFTLQTQWVATP